jgi:hypothetical protein
MESYLKDFLASLQEMQDSKMMVDVSLVLPDESNLPCHKLILMASCPFFRTMFNAGLNESADKEVRLDFPETDVIKAVIKFILHGQNRHQRRQREEICCYRRLSLLFISQIRLLKLYGAFSVGH